MIRSFNTLPPAESLEGMEDLSPLLEEYEQTATEWRQCNVEYEQLRLTLPEARRGDEKASVEAYRSGESDPGPLHEEKVNSQMAEVVQRQRVREGALKAVERELAGEAQKARERIPQIEAAIAKDSREMAKHLEKIAAIQKRRALRRGLIEWLTDLPQSFRPIPHVSGGITEDTALGVLVGSIREKSSGSDEGSIRLVG